MNFATYEEGKLTLEEYLGRVVFYEKRAIPRAEFRRFMFAQSKPYPQMIELVCKLKTKYGLKIAVVSNEARELNAYRIRKFKLDGFVDFFVSSCFVQIRKPDADIFRYDAGARRRSGGFGHQRFVAAPGSGRSHH
jgi:putative hydrolase of the HAD superfamily